MRRLWGKYSFQEALERATYWQNQLRYTNKGRVFTVDDPEIIEKAKLRYTFFCNHIVIGINAIAGWPSWKNEPPSITIESLKELTNDHNDTIEVWSYIEDNKVELIINGKTHWFKRKKLKSPEKENTTS